MIFSGKNRRLRQSGLLLHVGAGDKPIPGWVNIDRSDGPGIDLVADVTEGFDFHDAAAVYAEHFLEHLPVADAVRFLGDVHRALAPGGLLRITTPNLEWVWATHYRLDLDDEEKRTKAIGLNRAFRAWGHCFLWNRELLETALAACGFTGIDWCRRGESRHRLFRDLESHETYVDVGELQHVIIAEATRGPERPERLEVFLDLIGREYLDHVESP
jgi:predicted SAM-dependent methyltransferase